MVNVVREISNLLRNGSGLSGKVVRGSFWVFALRLTNRLLGLVSTMILARVLAPADFGLFGIALLTMAAIDNFSQVGMNAALVQKRQDITPYLDTAWTFQALRGGFLALVLFVSAPYVASFFDTPAATPVLQVIGVSTLIQGLTNIGVVFFQKELEFHKQYIYQLSGTVAQVSVAIGAVLILQNVWALVFGLLAGNLAQLLVSYAIHPYRPRPRLERTQFWELLHFGKWVLGSNVLIYLVTQGDSILVGKVLGVTALGLYQMAYRISNLPATEITHVISQVTFPAYAKLQNDLSRLKEAYFKVLQVTAFLSLLITVLIFIFANDFTRLFLGDKWLPMVPAMQILVLGGFIRSIAATAGAFFVAVGKPSIDTQAQLLRLITLSISIYPLTVYFGITGTSVAVLVSNIAVAIILMSKIFRFCESSLLLFAKNLFSPRFL